MRIDEDRIPRREVDFLVSELEPALAVKHDVTLVDHDVTVWIHFVVDVGTLGGTDGDIPNLEFERPFEPKLEVAAHCDGSNATVDFIHDEHVVVATLNT